MRESSMSDPKFHRSRLPLFASSLLALGLMSAAMVVSTGCAQAESNNWAQTSPLIEPEKRNGRSYHLSAHDDVVHAEDDEDMTR